MLFLTSASALSFLLLAQTAPTADLGWQQIGPDGVFTFVTSPDYANDGLAWIATGSVNHEGDGDFHLVTGHGDAVQLLSSLPQGDDPQLLTISPTFAVDQTMFATSGRILAPATELWKSTDAGASWVKLPQPSPQPWGNFFKDLALSPSFALDQVMIASPGGQGGNTYRSADGGATWILNPFPTFDMRDITFAEDFATSGFAYGIRRTTPTFHRSTDFGFVFNQCSHPLSNPGICAGVLFANGIEAAPVGPQGQRPIFYFGKGDAVALAPQNFVRSLDNGSNWDLGTGPGSAPGSSGHGLEGLTIFDLAIADNGLGTGRLYAATSNGVHVSEDNGTTFAPLDAAGLPTLVSRIELAGGPGGDLYVLAGGFPDPHLWGSPSPGATQPGNLYRLRLSGTGAVDLGFPLAGVNGEPQLTATSAFGATNRFALELTDAAPSAAMFQVFGNQPIFAPVFGGTLVPRPEVLVPRTTDASGSLTTPLLWPASLPPGSSVYAQAWIVDAAALQGFAASNGLKVTKL